MPRVLVLCLAAVLAFVLAFAPLARAAAGGAGPGGLILAPFDPGPLGATETRLLQAALAASGDYSGALDGRWNDDSATALAAWSAREFGGAALNAHAAAAVAGFLDAAAADGWREAWLGDLGLAIALPLDRLTDAADEAGGTRRWTADGTFTVLTHRFARSEAAAWHEVAAAQADGRADTSRRPDRLVTTGTLADGRAFYTRSDLVAGIWATVYLAAEPSALGALQLAAASLHAGRPEPFAVPTGGWLARLLTDTEALIAATHVEPAPDPAGATFAAVPASFETQITAALPAGPDRSGTGGTGTGFYLAPRLILTAAHVVASCARPTLADGTRLERIASDARLDIAVLRAPRPAGRWLALADARIRLGQPVHAIGFPYFSIAGTSLTLTSGNVSALAGIDDDRRFFSFTAPVQPGNSGGPLLDAHGRVLGLVVARLSEDYIIEATGSLPQNVNYALSESELAGFLASHGIAEGEGGTARFDPAEGVPDGVDSAIVPIICG